MLPPTTPPATAYRLPTGRIVTVHVTEAPPMIQYALTSDLVVVAIRADLPEPY